MNLQRVASDQLHTIGPQGLSAQNWEGGWRGLRRRATVRSARVRAGGAGAFIAQIAVWVEAEVLIVPLDGQSVVSSGELDLRRPGLNIRHGFAFRCPSSLPF